MPTINYPAISNTVIAKFNEYKTAVGNDSAKSVVDGTKKAMDEALKAHNTLVDKAVYSAFLGSEKPLDGIAAMGKAPRLVCKANDAKELVLEHVDMPINLHGFLSHAKAEKVKVTSADDYLKMFYALRYHVNARVTKDMGGDTSKFSTAFGIVPVNVVGVTGKDKTSTTQLTLLLKAFMESLNADLNVDNRDVSYILYQCTSKNRKELGDVVIAGESTFWSIALDVYRRAMDAVKFAYTVTYKESKKAAGEKAEKPAEAPATDATPAVAAA